MKLNQIIARALMIIIYISIGIISFSIGRGHRVFLNNYSVGENSSTATVIIDNQKPVVVKADRLVEILVKGQKHKARIEYSNGFGTIEGNFELPVFDDASVLLLNSISPDGFLTVIKGTSGLSEH